jgi:hypothetical protein
MARGNDEPPLSDQLRAIENRRHVYWMLPDDKYSRYFAGCGTLQFTFGLTPK